jgi:hypothetical protein
LSELSPRDSSSAKTPVLQDNAGALAFYRSNGFVVVGIEKTVELGGTELAEIRLRKGLSGTSRSADRSCLTI